MLTISTPEMLVYIANNTQSNHVLTYFEAKLLLGYLEGSGYSLLYSQDGQGGRSFLIQDNQDSDVGNMGYSLRYVIAECSDLCSGILFDATRDDNSTKEYIEILERDEYILDRLYLDYEE